MVIFVHINIYLIQNKKFKKSKIDVGNNADVQYVSYYFLVFIKWEKSGAKI